MERMGLKSMDPKFRGVNTRSLVIALTGALAMAVFAAGPPKKIQFTDVTAQAGIKFVHNAGKTGRKYLPETVGSGAAFFDADGDGWPDILLINSRDWAPSARHSTAA